MTPGKRIRKLRLTKDIGQKELADHLGYQTYTTVSKWESDISLPPAEELKKLAMFFNSSTDYILGIDLLNEEHVLSAAIGLPFFESIDAALLRTEGKQSMVEVSQLSLKEKKEHYFGVQLTADSINQLIPASYTIIVLDFTRATDQSLATGDLLIVQLDHQYKIVRLRKTDLIMSLEPVSFIKGFETVSLTLEEFDNLHIVGKIVASYQLFDS